MAYNGTIPEGCIASTLALEDPTFIDLVEQFVRALPDRIETMGRAIKSADFEALRSSAHQLKGCGGGYGYPVLTECAAKLEGFAKNHALTDCIVALEELQELCARVVVTGEGRSKS